MISRVGECATDATHEAFIELTFTSGDAVKKALLMSGWNVGGAHLYVIRYQKTLISYNTLAGKFR